MTPESDQPGFDLSELLGALRRRWYIVFACVVLVAAATIAFSATRNKMYQASATMLFEDSGLNQGLLGVPAAPSSNDQQRTAATNKALASLSVVKDLTATALRGRVPEDDIDVQIKQPSTNNVATATATARSPQEAALIATAFAEQFIAFRGQSAKQTVKQAMTPVRNRINKLKAVGGRAAEIRQLQSRLQDLTNLATLQTGDVTLIQRAKVPTDPSSPKTKRNTAIAVFFGLLLGLALAMLRDRLDRRVRTSEEIETVLEAPVLAIIPQSKALPRQHGGLEQLPPPVSEAFRLLRAELRYYQGSADASTILITSSSPEEGKSTVGWNLALAAAESGTNTLLVEADLRRPGLPKMTDAPARRHGLSTVLSRQGHLDEAIVNVTSHGTGLLHVLYAGPRPPNPADLLQSDNMRELLADAKTRYEFIVVDAAPITVVADTIPLVDYADGVLIVSRVSHTNRDRLLVLKRQLERLRAHVLGVVVNGVARGGDASVYDGYGITLAAPTVVEDTQLVTEGSDQRAAQ
jgi:capsular exopolysaccharide synthesis family protein